MHDHEVFVTGGVDTHADFHVAVVIDQVGRTLGTETFEANLCGYRRLLRWMQGFGTLASVGVEGTGTYGAGLHRHLKSEDVRVAEVDRPNRQMRRRRGKSDPTDAEAAARTALAGEATTIPKSKEGAVEGLRALRVARRSALKARTQAENQIRDLIVTSPEHLREKLSPLKTPKRIETCARMRPKSSSGAETALKTALRILAVRHKHFDAEIAELDAEIAALCLEINPSLVGAPGLGPETASALLVAAGDNPERLRSEGSFAALCGASPVEASSGKVRRHRLNRGGNREANHALWRIAFGRLHTDERTKAYAERRRSEGLSDKEIIRCLKRYIAREVFGLIMRPEQVPAGPELRALRHGRGLTLANVADAIGSSVVRISQLETEKRFNSDLAKRYESWLSTAAS
jgi:transposase